MIGDADNDVEDELDDEPPDGGGGGKVTGFAVVMAELVVITFDTAAFGELGPDIDGTLFDVTDVDC